MKENQQRKIQELERSLEHLETRNMIWKETIEHTNTEMMAFKETIEILETKNTELEDTIKGFETKTLSFEETIKNQQMKIEKLDRLLEDLEIEKESTKKFWEEKVSKALELRTKQILEFNDLKKKLDDEQLRSKNKSKESDRLRQTVHNQQSKIQKMKNSLTNLETKHTVSKEIIKI